MTVRAVGTTGRIPTQIEFNTVDNTGSNDERLVIQSNGNVAIGQSYANYPLQLNSSNNGVAFGITDENKSGNLTHAMMISNNNAVFQMKDSTASLPVYLNTSGNSWLTGGNVGIGTSSPDNRFHLLDGSLKVEHTSTASGYNNHMFLSNATGQSLLFRYNYDADSSIPDSVWQFRSSGSNTKGFVFSKANGTLLMSLGAESSSGRVGIGLNDPTSRLEVDGDLEIDGNGSVGDDAFYFGDPDTNGTWRIIRDGDDLSFERRESGSWVFKMKIND
jgi:hypothetical protein